MTQNSLRMEEARAALAFLLDDGIVVENQVPGFSLSTTQAENALEARLAELGWDGDLMVEALGGEFDFPYYAYDAQQYDPAKARAAAARIVTALAERAV